MRGHALEHHAGRLLVADVVRQLHRAIGRHQPLLRIAAERHHIGDTVADLEIGHAGADRDHLAGAFIAGDERHADRRRIHAHAEIRVDEIDAAGVLLDLDLARAGRGDLDLLVGQDFGTAGLVNPDCRDHVSLLDRRMVVVGMEIGGDHRQPRGKRKADQRAPETRRFAPLI